MLRAARDWSTASPLTTAWGRKPSLMTSTSWVILTSWRTSLRTPGTGKYRRPARLYQPDFATPQQGDLMWVYEGMTQYWGNVLATRSGLKSPAQYRDLLAMSAAQLDYKSGREWRPTEDTAVAGSLIRGGNQDWANWRRSQDYYQEGELVWLDADTTIRKLTDNKKSLDDFVAIFLGKGGNTGPLIVGYEFPELARGPEPGGEV